MCVTCGTRKKPDAGRMSSHDGAWGGELADALQPHLLLSLAVAVMLYGETLHGKGMLSTRNREWLVPAT